MLILNALARSIRGAATHNPDVQEPPACILWPDGDRQWDAVIPGLQQELPELFTLGTYAEDKRSGPAIWLRCVIANRIENITWAANTVPVLYLPGISRQELRAVETCPDALKPLAELQFRGIIWSQNNAKDWTILSYLKSSQGGLGLDVALDNDSKHAMQLALFRVLDEELDILRGRHLDKDYFNTLLSGGDPVRDLLQWLDQGGAFRASRDENAWRGFVEVCKSVLGIDPEKDGPIKAASMLAYRKGPWSNVWGRFCESPQKYANVPKRIRETAMPMDFFEDKSAWPQWNEQEETNLRDSLFRISKQPPHDARAKILQLAKNDSSRCNTVWSELGQAPLANALVFLATVADVTSQSLAAGTAADMAAAYQKSGWKADDAALRAIAEVHTSDDTKAIQAVLQTIYLPWVDEAARYLQSHVDSGQYPWWPFQRSSY